MQPSDENINEVSLGLSLSEAILKRHRTVVEMLKRGDHV
jgi:hypothetical protein